MNTQRLGGLLDDAWNYVVTAARFRQLGDEASAQRYFKEADERLMEAKIIVEIFKNTNVKVKLK